MTTVTPTGKDRVIKTLAVFGLLGIIVLTAWLAVQLVNVFPKAVTSLASLADSVYSHKLNEDYTFKFLPSATSTISGEVLVINWSALPKTGSFTFKYTCVEGLIVEIQTGNTLFKNTTCNTPYSLGLTDEVSLIIYSGKDSEVTFSYSVAYFKTNAREETTSESNSLMVLNPNLVVVEPETTPEPRPTEAVKEGPVSTTTPAKPTAPVTVAPVKPKPVVTAPTYTYTYSLPLSDPYGFTDLKLTYLGIGKLNSRGEFINTGKLVSGEAGAIQFSVQNIGTKTSTPWQFETILPGTIKYESKQQVVLKPKERTIMVIEFPAVNDRGTETFSIKVTGGNDNNLQNNTLNWSTAVVRQ